MPPKLKKEVLLPFVKDENKLYEVDKEFFNIQYKAKEKTIKRLTEKCVLIEEEVENYITKNKMLKIELDNDYVYMKEKLNEKDVLEDLLYRQLEQILKEKNSASNTYNAILKEKDDNFMRTAGLIKSKTAIYVGRLNKLEEFLEQEDTLEKKNDEIKNVMSLMNETHQKLLNDMEFKYIRFKKVLKKNNIKRAVDFGIQMQKELFENLDPVLERVFLENNIIKKKLYTYKLAAQKISEEYDLTFDKSLQLDNNIKVLKTNNLALMNIKMEKQIEMNKLNKSISLIENQIESFQKKSLKYPQILDHDYKIEKEARSAIYNECIKKRNIHALEVELNLVQMSNIEYKKYNAKIESFFIDVLNTLKEKYLKESRIKTISEKQKIKKFLEDLCEKLESYLVKDLTLLPVNP